MVSLLDSFFNCDYFLAEILLFFPILKLAMVIQ